MYLALQFSRIESRKLHAAWLAWKDIQSNEFIKAFKPIWNGTLNEIANLFKKCNYYQNVCEIGTVGLTINPGVGFAFSPIVEAYEVNIWSFFFCNQKNELSAFFSPSFLVASKLVHEYSHYKFWKQHDVLGKTRQVKLQFDSIYGLEDEKYALTQELNFLNQMIEVIPHDVKITMFRVKSWDRYGQPSCEGLEAQFP